MKMLVPAGMMSPYFITRPDRSTADMTEPSVLVARLPLTLDVLALFLAFLDEEAEPPRKRGFRFLGGNGAKTASVPAPERARAMLRAITAETRWPGPGELVWTSHPVAVLTPGTDLPVLQALTVIKLRGFVQCLAVDISSCMELAPGLQAFVAAGQPGGAPAFTAAGGLVAGYRARPGLAVVSGMRATAFAFGTTPDQLFAEYPELAAKAAGV